jgi:hypothetical protein
MRICVVNSASPPAIGSRSERWLNLTRELIRAGHEVTLLRSALPVGIAGDAGLERALLELDCRTITLPPGMFAAWQSNRSGPHLLQKVRQGISQLIWPDHWLGFGLAAARWIEDRPSEFDLAISSGFPWSNHLAGFQAANRGMVWIADYGDPWGIENRGERWCRNAEYASERRLLAAASGLIVTTVATEQLFEQHYPDLTTLTLPAGVSDLALGPPPARSALNLLQAGNVYGPRASVAPFAAAVRRITATCRLPVTLTWCGEIWRETERQAVEACATEYMARVDQQRLRELEREATVVVVFGNSGGTQIPGKIWRSLASNRIVLVILADSHDPLGGLAELSGRSVVTTNDPEAIFDALHKCEELVGQWPWDEPSRLPKLPTWKDRAERLLEFIESQRRSHPTRRTSTRTNPRLLATWNTISGTKLSWVWSRIKAQR